MIGASSTGVAVTSHTRWPGVEMHLRQRPGARPDPVGHQLVVDLLAERDELVDRPARDERQRGVAVRRPMPVGLPAADPELDLLPGEAEQIGGGEELPGGQAPREVEDRRADHHRVVDVEERGGRLVGRDRQRGLDLGGGRGSDSGHDGGLAPVAPPA